MDTNTIEPIAGYWSIGSLQRIEPATNSGRRKPSQQKRQKAKQKARYSNEVLYTPDGQVESEEHGVKVDVSA